MASPSQVLYCRCAYAKVVPADAKERMLLRLVESGQPFHAVPDLCEMAARKDPALKSFSEAESLQIVACYPRAVKALFRLADVPLNDETCEILNMREENIEPVMNKIAVNGAGKTT